MVDLLKVPPVLSGLRFQRQHGNGEKIISGPNTAVEIRSRVTCGEVNQAQLRIHCRCLPHCGATVFPCIVVLRPGIMTNLARTRNRVEGPDQVSVLRIVGLDPASRTVLAAGKADDDQSVEVKGCGRNRVTVLPALRLNGPRRFARFLIQRHQAAVQLSHINLALTQREATARPAAADGGDGLVKVWLILPESLACLHANRENIVCSRDDIDDAFMNDGLSLAGILGVHARAVEARSPDSLQAGNGLSIDLRQGGVVLVEEIAAIFEPVGGRRSPEFFVGKCRARGDTGIRESGRVCLLLRMQREAIS